MRDTSYKINDLFVNRYYLRYKTSTKTFKDVAKKGGRDLRTEFTGYSCKDMIWSIEMLKKWGHFVLNLLVIHAKILFEVLNVAKNRGGTSYRIQ